MLQELKFKESDFEGKDIASLPDNPSSAGFSAAQLKARFDMVPKILVAMGAFNNLVDVLDTHGAEALHLEGDLAQIKSDIEVLNSSESVRAQGEIERINAEIGRIQAEAVRITDENARVANENTRLAAENQRNTDENARKSNEIIRNANEGGRVEFEELRITEENARKSAEISRNQSEIARNQAEALRDEAETTRIANEQGRIASMSNFEFQGPWSNRLYSKYNMVKSDGKVYMANVDTSDKPPSESWILLSSEGTGLNITSAFNSLADLQSNYPNGADGLYAVGTKVYLWNGSWTMIADLSGGADEEEVNEMLDTKVDKEQGKGLSTNDYTTVEKTKLAGIATGANATTIINNLTTGGTKSALSAEQGKVLFQTVVNGKNAIATAINDLTGNSVANSGMTHTDLSVIMRNNMMSKSKFFTVYQEGLSDFSALSFSDFYVGSRDNIYKYPNRFSVMSRTSNKSCVVINHMIDFSKYKAVLYKALCEDSNSGGELSIITSVPTHDSVVPVFPPTVARSSFNYSTQGNNPLGYQALGVPSNATFGYLVFSGGGWTALGAVTCYEIYLIGK